MVTKPDGTVFEFQESPTGLYYMDTKVMTSAMGQVMVNTVADNKSSYTDADYL